MNDRLKNMFSKLIEIEFDFYRDAPDDLFAYHIGESRKDWFIQSCRALKNDISVSDLSEFDKHKLISRIDLRLELVESDGSLH